MTTCCCGNDLESRKAIKIVVSPCRCRAPGRGRRTMRPTSSLPEYRRQYEQRKRTGLPMMTDVERAVKTRWV